MQLVESRSTEFADYLAEAEQVVNSSGDENANAFPSKGSLPTNNGHDPHRLLESEGWQKPPVPGSSGVSTLLNELRSQQVVHQESIEALLRQQEKSLTRILQDSIRSIASGPTKQVFTPPVECNGNESEILQKEPSIQTTCTPRKMGTVCWQEDAINKIDPVLPNEVLESPPEESKVPLPRVSMKMDSEERKRSLMSIKNSRVDYSRTASRASFDTPAENPAYVSDDSTVALRIEHKIAPRKSAWSQATSVKTCRVHMEEAGKRRSSFSDLEKQTVDEHLKALEQMKQSVTKGLRMGAETLKARRSMTKSSSRTSPWEQIEGISIREGITWMVKHRQFEMAVCISIVLNAITIGLEADMEMQHPTRSTWIGFRVFNLFFVVTFAIELLLRIYVERFNFFVWYNVRIGWNVFDTFLVCIALVEEVVQAFFDNDSADMSVLRILRTLRIVRGFRIVRVFAFFRDLRIMVAGIMYSLYSLVWAILLLISMMYLFSVVLLQFAVDEHMSHVNQDQNPGLNPTDYGDLMNYFGSLARTIYTLYCSIVGGLDWGDAAAPLLKLSPFLGVLYSFYVAFAVLCVLNIITGVFVENANRTTAQDEEMVLMEQMEIRRQWFEEVKELFEAADTDGSGQLDADEFTIQMQDLRMQAWFRKIGVAVEAYSARGLFQLLDFDNDGKLDLDEFAMALQQVHGPARSIDVAKVNREVSVMHRELKALSQVIVSFFDEIRENMFPPEQVDGGSELVGPWYKLSSQPPG
jgi:Ca2+-binding EF-hand superfamily protein